MTIRPFAVIGASSLLLGLLLAASGSQTAWAACYDNSTKPPTLIPCSERAKKPTATDVPATAASTSAPVTVQSVVVTPDASQLAALCAALPLASGGSALPNPAAEAPGSPKISPPVVSGKTNGVLPYAIGVGGLLAGLLIGLGMRTLLLRSGLWRGAVVAPKPPSDDDDENIRRVRAEIYEEPVDFKYKDDTWA